MKRIFRLHGIFKWWGEQSRIQDLGTNVVSAECSVIMWTEDQERKARRNNTRKQHLKGTEKEQYISRTMQTPSHTCDWFLRLFFSPGIHSITSMISLDVEEEQHTQPRGCMRSRQQKLVQPAFPSTPDPAGTGCDICSPGASCDARDHRSSRAIVLRK